jgi:23S rRNA (adenine2503-C2)-methyltransferase
MTIQEIRHRLRTLGAKPCHEEEILRRWLQAVPLDCEGIPGAKRPPAAVCAALPALAAELAALARVHSQHAGDDGSARLLVDLADGQQVESVLLPRDGVCVSTQVGCAVGCVFCMTGRDGLRRQLSDSEIVAQVVLARARRPVKKVVFMGMGEPAHNLDNVMAAIDLLHVTGGIAQKNLVFSTVGDRRVFERLPSGPVKPALALSLHTTNAELRARLLPRAPRIDPAELVELAERYARATHYPIQYQWTVLEGVNDSDAELDAIARLLAGKYAVMNLIPYNPVEGGAFARPSVERAEAMSLYLYRRGILTKLRQSAGQDVDGGCGQLRARSALARRRSASAPPTE